MQIKLTDGTWVEGTTLGELDDYMTLTGIWLHNAHHSIKDEPVPLGERVFVPFSNILYIVIEE